jgi:hypothetical protein
MCVYGTNAKRMERYLIPYANRDCVSDECASPKEEEREIIFAVSSVLR